jgi:NhaA family Na+:H+ antiporter
MSSRVEDRPIDRLLMPFQRFLRIEAAGGILLLVATAVALVWANSPWGDYYYEFWHKYLSVSFGEVRFEMSLAHFVNDGLMAIFFFVVGLEIKRELIAGELASLRKAAIPFFAAVGGMAVPALVYVAINLGDEDMKGWAIPCATDIAFAIGIMSLLGKRVPVGLKVFLTALAIADDLGAVLVIAIFYTNEIAFEPLIGAAAALMLSVIANRLQIRTPMIYAVIGIFMWLMLLKSGVHATVGGVLLALTIPVRVRLESGRFAGFAREAVDEYERFEGDDILVNAQRQRALLGLEEACEDAQTPLNRMEHELHPLVAFVIMPVFALVNAGIPLGGGFDDAIGSGTGLGVALGLVIGKPVGIVLATFAAVRLGLGRLPEQTSWRQIVGAGCLAGVGFTMSLFIANLAFDEGPSLALAKAAILGVSLVSGVAGFVLLRSVGGRD